MTERSRRPILFDLWRAVASGRSFAPGRRLEESEISWAIEVGMGPLLHAAAESGAPECVPEPLRVRLKASDRWARVHHADMLETATALIDRCADRAPPLTLLKGISVADELYPQPHQRVLGDLDLLVEPEGASAVMATLAEQGFRPTRPAPGLDYATHHHLGPVVHPRTRVCVEVHTGLFPPRLDFGEGTPFAPPVVRAERRPSTLEGRPVFRLGFELQLLYVASHWALDFVATAGARSLLDTILLLRSATPRIAWDRVLAWLDDRRIAAHLQLMLHYLAARDLVERPARLRAEPDRWAVLPPTALRILTGMIDRYQICGRMRHVRALPEVGADEAPRLAPGSLRARLRTLRTAASTRNAGGLLLAADLLAWETLLRQPPSRWRTVCAAWCRLLPPGDPDRLPPRRRRARARGGARERTP